MEPHDWYLSCRHKTLNWKYSRSRVSLLILTPHGVWHTSIWNTVYWWLYWYSMIYWYGEEHICTAPKKVTFLTLFHPDGISMFSQQQQFHTSGFYRDKNVKKKKQTQKTPQSILSPCCCVNLLMLVYCKLYWCVSLVNCTELVIVNTGFYFVFWA